MGRSTGLSAAGALGVLVAAAPRPGAAFEALRAPDPADVTGPVVAVAALLAWALSAWLLAVVATTLLSRTGGPTGSLGRAAARRLAPRAVRRAVEVTLGLTVSVSALAAPAAAAAPGSAGAGPDSPPPAASLDWPGAGTAAELDWPLVAPPADGAAAGPPGARPPSAPVRAAALPGTAGQPVVVAAGDSLWRLAEQHLARTTGEPPTASRTADAWPAWWTANREAVGEDPHLLIPGTVLRPPADPSTP